MKNTVANAFDTTVDVRTYAGDNAWVLPTTMIGLEVELEGIRDNPVRNSPLWSVTEDGSLRAVNGVMPYELRFAMPLCGVDLTRALNDLEQGLAKLKNPPEFSSRTSWHVHLDVRDLQLHHLLKVILFYTVFEQSFFRFCGNNREHNIYCLPFYSAEAGLFNILSTEVVTSAKSVRAIANENYRYSALNLAALRKFGTIEFRHMPGTGDIQKIRNWINLIMCLKQYALIKEELHLKEMPKYFSSTGFMQCAYEVFKDYTKLLDGPNFQIEIINGIRQAQDIIYRAQLEEISQYIHTQLQGDDYPEGIKAYAKRNKLSLGNKTPKQKGKKIPYPYRWDIVVDDLEEEQIRINQFVQRDIRRRDED